MNLEIKNSPESLPGQWKWLSLNNPKNTLPLTEKPQKYFRDIPQCNKIELNTPNALKAHYIHIPY